MNNPESVLDRLAATIEQRKTATADSSYTARLFAGGVEKIGGKITEEAAEVVAAAREEGEEGRQHLVREAADVVYHLLVMLSHRGAAWSEVEAELARRFGVSGLAEKAARGSSRETPAS